MTDEKVVEDFDAKGRLDEDFKTENLVEGCEGCRL